MKCPRCSNEIPNNATFCAVCGTPLSGTNTATQQLSNPASTQQYSAQQTSSLQDLQLVSQIPKVQIIAPFNQNFEMLLQQQNEILQKEKKTLRANRWLVFLLLITAIGIGYLAFVQYRQTHSSDSLDSSNRVLVIQIDDDLESSEVSDDAQIENALKNGGMIRLNLDLIDRSLKKKIDKYAATTSSGHYWVMGALLNYISSEGWELIQAPATGLSQMYYFKKK